MQTDKIKDFVVQKISLKFSRKRGQIGVFILLGLILLIGFGFVIYLKESGIKKAVALENINFGKIHTKKIERYINKLK